MKHDLVETMLENLIRRKNLSEGDMGLFLENVIKKKIEDVLLACFLTGLAIKGESKEELLGAVKVFKRYTKVVRKFPFPVIDTCGTGGKLYPTLNVSTLSAFVIASLGAKVAKHGNLSYRGMVGSAQILKAFGANIEVEEPVAANLLEKVGISFFFAPYYHPAMQAARSVRNLLPFRTIFNLLGPLSNPVRLTYQVVGVFNICYVRVFAECLRDLGVVRAAVVYGHDGQDELTVCSKSTLALLMDSRIEVIVVLPTDFGLPLYPKEKIEIRDPGMRVQTFKEVLEGRDGPYLDLVTLNAGLALFICGIANNISEGIGLAKESIKTGRVKSTFHAFLEGTKNYGRLPG